MVRWCWALGVLIGFAFAPSLAEAQATADPFCNDTGPDKIQPIASTHTLPPYPGLSTQLGEKGPTDLLVKVGLDGLPQSVSVSVPSGFPRLDSVAQSYVQANWRWQPPQRSCLAQVRIAWNISAGTEPPAPEPPLMSVIWQSGLTTNGAATYDIDLKTPPGTNGMDPTLSLHYDSLAAGLNYLGHGWDIFGLPATIRCPQKPDAFCKTDSNNDRLVAIKGGYGANGTEYRRHFQDFSRTISHGGANGEPEWFEVANKNGLIIEMGRTPDSREIDPGTGKILAWRVNSVTDTVGTYYTVHWEKDSATGILHPLRIDFSGNQKTALQPYNSVRFVYDAGPVKLRHIQAFLGERMVTDYRLDYAQGALATLSHCDGQSNCLAPLTFHWRDFDTASGKLTLPTDLDDGIGRRNFFVFAPAPKPSQPPHASYPELLVSRVDSTDSNGKRTGNAYGYEGEPIYNENGSFAGFSTETRLEDRTGLKTVNTYSTQPETADEMTGEITSLNGLVVKSVKSDWAFRTDQPDVIFPYLAKKSERNNDLDGSAMAGSDVIYAYDEFGAVTREETHWTDGSSKLSEDTYWSDAAHWHLARLLGMHVTRMPAAPALDRESSFQYDRSTALLTQEVIEPKLRPYRLQTDYDHDAYGHRIEETQSGVDIPNLRATTRYDAHGAFVIAVNENTSSWKNSTVDPLTGFYESAATASGSQKWSHDGFGRVLQYSQSGGNAYNNRFGYCSEAGAPPCPQYSSYYVDQTANDLDHHLFSYLNSHGLIVAVETLIRGKRKTTETREYDDRDNIIRYCHLEDDAMQCRDRTYDPLGRPIKETWPNASVTWTYHGLTQTRSDSFGNALTIVKDAQGHVLSLTSDDGHGSHTARFTYDGWGNKVQVIDIDGRVTKANYNVRGLLVSEIRPDGSVTSERYNVLGQKIE